MVVTKSTERVNFDTMIGWRDDVSGVETPVVQIMTMVDSSSGSTQSFKNVLSKATLDEHKDEIVASIAVAEKNIEERVKTLGLDFYAVTVK